MPERTSADGQVSARGQWIGRFIAAVLFGSVVWFLWSYKVDALIGVNTATVTGPVRLNVLVTKDAQTQAPVKSYFLTIAGQPKDAPTEYIDFAPGAVDRVTALFGDTHSGHSDVKRCTIHLAGLGRRVVIDVTPAR